MESPPPVSFKHHLYAQAGFSLFARHVQVAFREGRHVEYVSRTLNVDHELKPHLIDRQITHSGPTLHMTDELKQLRVAAGGLMELVKLCDDVIEAFDTPEQHAQ